ncbi:secretion-regulating guanine nucleotide exchange factor isoform X1 [Solea senegalensis]|uniref:Secretion-regulating guanine nucleotide exchange factor isoform X1 n=1 Tax=Solea senegalensis TaxID=28829 RepID=A0AAV6SYW8_SOLSE|nr:secretion-regulating guanine nucleotide exchange factor isoform X1 [Solea senegalensis]KAG7522230.1 secretion-regulating guanine nucleotide exchange factor isoform X1 [Solea senegalensis]
MEARWRPEFCLLSWGANSYGQLGQGHAEDQYVPRFSDTAALHSKTFRAVAGGGGHSVFITENGEVYVCGQNHRGQLGLHISADISTLQLCPTLDQKITNVACGWDFTLFLTDCGQILACGSNSFGQLGVGEMVTHSADLLFVKCLKNPVVSVAAGLRHSLAVTDSGCVYQWGTGLFTHAKRALSPHPVPSHLSSKVPCLVPGLDQKISCQIAAGSTHCVCLTGDGDLFLWGSNKYGQLTATESFVSSPCLLKRSLLDGEKAIHVWSGWTHIVAQTERGRVFTWGRANYGQLGRQASASQNPEHQSAGPTEGANQEVCLPSEVKVLCGATQVACGSEHNLAIVGGSLFSWGWNEHGMCGDGSQADVVQPQLISGLRPCLIGCGAGHSVAVCCSV